MGLSHPEPEQMMGDLAVLAGGEDWEDGWLLSSELPRPDRPLLPRPGGASEPPGPDGITEKDSWTESAEERREGEKERA